MPLSLISERQAASFPKPTLSMIQLLGLLLLVARLLVCATLAVAAAEHLQRHRRTPAGWGRVAAAAPVAAALHLAPLLFDPVTEPWAVVLCLNFPWLSGSAVGAEGESGRGAGDEVSLPAGPAARTPGHTTSPDLQSTTPPHVGCDACRSSAGPWAGARWLRSCPTFEPS